jgi:uncharacterized protein (DUF4415 family)
LSSARAIGEKEGTEATAMTDKTKKANFQPGRGYSKAYWGEISVTLRLDSEIVERFRANGKGWQSRINETLKRA